MDKDDILVVIAELLRKQDKMIEVMNGFMGQTSEQLSSHNNILEKHTNILERHTNILERQDKILEKQSTTLEELKKLAVRQQDYNEMFYNELKLTGAKIDTLDKKFDKFTKPGN